MQSAHEKVTPLKIGRRSQLINRLNVLHFQDLPLLVCLRHKEHGHMFRVKARPQPVTDEHVTASWVKDDGFPAMLAAFDLVSIILTGVHRSFEFIPERYWLDESSINFVVPETAQEAKARKYPRFDCRTLNVSVTLTQNALVFSGRLLEFSVGGVLVALDGTLNWLNTAISALLTIRRDEDIVYAGQVTMASRGQGQYLLKPGLEPTPRCMPRRHRARRQQFVPSPDLVFPHPVTGRKHVVKVKNLGSLGFAVDEQETSSVLIPGLLIRQAQLSFANSLCLPCLVQVVHTQPADEAGIIRSGMAILDIDLQDHLKLISLVQQAEDPRAYISNQVDPDDLFEFFFDTGFLYPHKYAEKIACNRDHFRQAYHKLYAHRADISRHFVYQSAGGQILGHFATVRVYRQTWLNQHHAALNRQRAGLKVVRAISEYMNDSFQLNPANIAYIIGYYRPDNKFPRHYFGEYVKSVDDPSQTSLDTFSYLRDASRIGSGAGGLASGWVLEKATAEDLVEFHGFYAKQSGGLLPQALDLTADGYRDDSLTLTYAASGLRRQRQLHALRHQGFLKALIDVQDSDAGLNLSEITNATTVYVLDSVACHRDIMRAAIGMTVPPDKMHHPVMFYPNTYLTHYNIESDTEYTLWALSILKASESYMAWMNRYCR